MTAEIVLRGEASPKAPLKQRSRKWVPFWAKGVSRWRTCSSPPCPDPVRWQEKLEIRNHQNRRLCPERAF